MSDFYYDLPDELIAQNPVEPRDSSRLFVYDRKTDSVSHKHFRDVYDLLNKGDLLVKSVEGEYTEFTFSLPASDAKTLKERAKRRSSEESEK